jgi:zinc transport system ATP-binding protein
MRVKFNNLSFSYGQKKIVNNLSFEIASGDFLSIIGKNGTGKSTIIKCLLKILRVPNDMIFIDDIDINNIQTFRNIGYVPQKVDFNYEFPITVKEILVSSYKGKVYDQFFKEVITLLDLNPLYNENINNLSGGQLQRIFIARALLTKPKLLVLDEPTVGVDQENLKSLHNILKKLKENKITIIMISHDLEFCNELTDYKLNLLDSKSYEFTKTIGEHNE